MIMEELGEINEELIEEKSRVDGKQEFNKQSKRGTREAEEDWSTKRLDMA